MFLYEYSHFYGNNLEQFNGKKEDDIGIDTQFNILTYAFVKANPNNIVTNYNYMVLFVEKDGEEDSILTQLKMIINFVNEVDYKKLIGVTQDEFNFNFYINNHNSFYNSFIN